MEDTLYFLFYYAAVLVCGAVLITGWYTVTRGEWYKNPDDTHYWSGKLFSPWLRFWTQENGKETFYYRGAELEDIVMQITNLLGIKDYRTEDETYLVANDAIRDILLKKRQYILHHLKVEFTVKEMLPNQHIVFFLKKYPTYTFPHWVRSPLATCIYCHGSIYGSLVWWLSAAIFKSYFNLPFGWGLIAIFWVPFIISQSFVAPYLEKKI